jgi:hypothetical protein
MLEKVGSLIKSLLVPQPGPEGEGVIKTLFMRFLGLLPPAEIDFLTYKYAIEYFVHQRPKDPTVAKGAILRQPSGTGFMVVQFFLNVDLEPVCDADGKPHGRRIAVKHIDPELEATFGGKDLIIVE